jgi:putative membrane-bound dehydrogenase-like protein
LSTGGEGRTAGLLAVALLLVASLDVHAAPARLRVLFLGDDAGHKPAERYRILAPVMKARGIDLVYTDKPADLNAANLAKYDALAVYANIDRIEPAQEKALLDFVAGGKGFVPIHCASFCFRNSDAYVALVGAQFRSHDSGVFRTRVVKPDHAIMKGYSPFSSWDETYTHTKHNEKDRIVLETRVEGKFVEPWTWVRTHGKGRVFYTAWGHDYRTWNHPGFQNLVERGIRWACNSDPAVVPDYVDEPAMTKIAKDAPAFSYVDAKVPFYPAGQNWGTQAKPLTKMQQPATPADSMKHMVTPADFEVKLWADEKLIGGKPICMNWDERGRLWVAVTMDYPNQLRPAGEGRDRIIILEDTKGTGVADKVTEFADKLSIPTSLTFWKGGVVVHQAPHTLYLKDTKGTGKADVRKILFTGWATNDTHAGPSNLFYGLDNWLHGIVGYAGYRGTIGGEQHSFRQGFYRFRPDGSKMEFLRNTNNNSWGIGFSEEGLEFGSTANGNPSVYLPIPNRYYESVRGWSSSVLGGIAGNSEIQPITDKVRQMDHHGHFTAAAGHALYTARTYPREYWNKTAFVCEPTAHLAATFALQRDGAGFRSRNAWNLLASDDEWCAPIMAEVGPDGHVWVLDWYNFIVQHNPTPAGYKTGKGGAYETDLRDKKHGRVYRVVYKKAPAKKTPDLSKATPKELVAMLKHDNMRWRLHAQRLLVERRKVDVVPELVKLVEDKSVDEIGLNVGAIHALWTLSGLGVVEWGSANETAWDAAVKAQKHPSAGVRRNAVQATTSEQEPSSSPEFVPGVRDRIEYVMRVDTNLLKDGDAQVRLAGLLGFAEGHAPHNAIGKPLAALLDDADLLADRTLADGLTAAAAAHAEPFLTHLAGRKADLSPRAGEVVKIVARHVGLGKAETVSAVLKVLPSCRIADAERVLDGLSQGKKHADAELTADTEKALVAMLPKLSGTGKATLMRVMTSVGSKAVAKHAAEIAASLLRTVEEPGTDADRVSAARQVVELLPDDTATMTKLLDGITPRTPPAVVAGILDALGTSTSPATGTELVKRLPAFTPTAKTQAVRVLLGRAAATKALLDALDKGTLNVTDLALDQRQALADHTDAAIRQSARKILAKGGDLPDADRQKVIDKLLPLTKKTGDPIKGKLVFENTCAKCHMHSGKGTQIGPDLTGMASHPKEELLIHIMDPSRSVEGNFRLWTVTTLRGQTFVGMLASETRTSIELIDAEAKKITLQRANVDELKPSNKSLMPEGFEKQLKEPEIVDLLEFMTQKGKYLPLPLDKVASAVSTRGMFFDPSGTAERLVFPDWKPKTFDGVPFYLVDPDGGKKPNVVLLYGPEGTNAPKMPKSVSLPVNTAAKAVHLLSGVSGWGYPVGKKGTVSLIVRLQYKDGKSEDHELKNGEQFADYIRRVDVPGSKFAFDLAGRQIRYLSIAPKRDEVISRIDLVKGTDRSAPVVMAVTVETK